MRSALLHLASGDSVSENATPDPATFARHPADVCQRVLIKKYGQHRYAHCVVWWAIISDAL
jgi:hypothetical protein